MSVVKGVVKMTSGTIRHNANKHHKHTHTDWAQVAEGLAGIIAESLIKNKAKAKGKHKVFK